LNFFSAPQIIHKYQDKKIEEIIVINNEIIIPAMKLKDSVISPTKGSMGIPNKAPLWFN
jgi:hypothetical protein